MKKTNCKVCGSADIYTIYHLDRTPAFQNKLFPTMKEAQKALVTEVDLCACPDCGLVFNALFDNSVMDYDDGYQNAQDHSPNFKTHLEEIADLIIDELRPSEKVVEIGCGKGFFMQSLKDRGIDIIGFDPAYDGDSKDIVKEYFSAETAGSLDVSAVIMRHTLEHIEFPYAFLVDLKKTLKGDARIFIEIPRLEWIVEHNAFWDIFHEHCNYFSEKFFHGIFSNKVKIESVFDGQYMLVSALLSDLVAEPVKGEYPRYDDIFSEEILKFSNTISKFQRNYIWGAGAKGIAFANILDPGRERIAELVDINPKKQGYFISLTGHGCVAPESVDWASLDKNDCLWIMNSRYKSEILASLPEIKCQVITLANDGLI